jgi:hypothetical protein
MGLDHGPTVAFFFWIGINSWARVAAGFLGRAPTKERLYFTLKYAILQREQVWLKNDREVFRENPESSKP